MSGVGRGGFVDDLLRDIDAARERAGWDAPADLLTVNVTILDDAAGVAAVSEFPAWSSLIRTSGYSWKALQGLELALEVASPPGVDLGGLIGVILVDEAWVNTVEAQERAGRALADIPGSTEQRFAWFWGLNGTTRLLLRPRGQDPTIGDFGFQSGRVRDGLGSVVDALAKQRLAARFAPRREP